MRALPLGTLALWLAVAWQFRPVTETYTLVVLLVGAAWLGAGLLTLRRRASAVLAAVVGAAWLVTPFSEGTVMWHRAVIVHLLLAGGLWWPRTWVARIVIAAAYVASVLAWPWAWPWTSTAIGGAVVVAAVVERGAAPVSVVRLAPWRGGTVLAATAFTVPPLLSAVGLGRDWALAVLVSYAVALVAVAALVVFANRPGDTRWATDLAVDLHSPPREAIERALAIKRGDPLEVSRDAEEALAAAARLRNRLAMQEADLARTLAETERSRRRLQHTDLQERRALRQELEAAAVRPLQRVLAVLAKLDEGETTSAVDVAVRHLGLAIEELDALGRGLLPTALDGGIRAALTRLAASSAVPVSIDLPDHAKAAGLTGDVEACIYYVAAESLANVAKHAAAHAVSLRLRTEPEVELVVRDDGVGGSDAAQGGSGIDGMRHRAAEVGGAVSVVSAPGRGTTVRLVVPGPPTAGGTAPRAAAVPSESSTVATP